MKKEKTFRSLQLINVDGHIHLFDKKNNPNLIMCSFQTSINTLYSSLLTKHLESKTRKFIIFFIDIMFTNLDFF